MSRVNRSAEIQNLTTLDDVKRFVNSWLTNITDNINGNLEFDINLRTTTVTVVFVQANVDVGIFHGLNKSPNGYFKASSSAALTLYDGAGLTTNKVIYLRSSAVGTAKILFY